MIDDIDSKQTWAALLGDPAAHLVDVRTPGEWQHVGIPDLSEGGKRPILVSWQFPTGQVNPAFLAELAAAGATADQRLYFLCRSGVRSLAAAEAAEAAGFAACFNVADGFEGPPDGRGGRGRVAGWQADGLPWILPG